MATVFWDSKGIILIDYKPAQENTMPMSLNNSAGVLLLHDNAPVHKSRVAQAAIRECKFEQLNHPPYSPDLALK